MRRRATGPGSGEFAKQSKHGYLDRMEILAVNPQRTLTAGSKSLNKRCGRSPWGLAMFVVRVSLSVFGNQPRPGMSQRASPKTGWARSASIETALENRCRVPNDSHDNKGRVYMIRRHHNPDVGRRTANGSCRESLSGCAAIIALDRSPSCPRLRPAFSLAMLYLRSRRPPT